MRLGAQLDPPSLSLSLCWKPRLAFSLRQRQKKKKRKKERKRDEAAGVPAADEADRSIRRINNPLPTRPQRVCSPLGFLHGTRRRGHGCLPEDPRTICPTDSFILFFLFFKKKKPGSLCGRTRNRAYQSLTWDDVGL